MGEWVYFATSYATCLSKRTEVLSDYCMIELESVLLFKVFYQITFVFEVMSFGSTWITGTKSWEKEFMFPCNKSRFCMQWCKTYFGRWLVYDILSSLDRLFQVIELIDDVLALLNLVSPLRHAGCLNSKHQSFLLSSVCTYLKVSNLDSIADRFPSQEDIKCSNSSMPKWLIDT